MPESIHGSILKPITFLFGSLKRVPTGYNLENVFGMSLRSESHRGNVLVSVSERPAATTTAEKSGGEIPGYKEVLKKHESVKKRPDPISEKSEIRRGCLRIRKSIQILNTSMQRSQSLFPCSVTRAGKNSVYRDHCL